MMLKLRMAMQVKPTFGCCSRRFWTLLPHHALLFSLSSLEPLFPISSFSCIFNLLSQEGWEKLCGASLPVLNVAVTEADNMARWRMIAMMGHIYIYIHMASHDDSTCLELQSASISCNLETGSHCCHHQPLQFSHAFHTVSLARFQFVQVSKKTAEEMNLTRPCLRCLQVVECPFSSRAMCFQDLSASLKVLQGQTISVLVCFGRGPEIETRPDPEPADSIKEKAGAYRRT